MPKGSKVLMADDDKMLLDMYKERLELAGYVVQSYYNGEDAIAHVHDFMPDIILLDVMMPKMNGYETLASLKSDPTTKNIPVVMLSALMRDFNREKAVEGGAEDYLIKSEAMPSDVITKIEQVLQKFGKGNTPVPGTDSAVSAAMPSAPTPPVEAPAAEVVKESDMVLSNDYKKDAAEAVDTTNAGKSEIESGFGSGPSVDAPTSTGDIESKVFTTPPVEVQNEDIKPSETQDATPGESEEKSNGSDDKKDQVIFEPTPDEDKESLDPLLDDARSEARDKEPEVATVTEIGLNDGSVANPNGSVPETPNSSSVFPAEMTKSNTLVILIIAAIIVLLAVGGIAFYLAFIKK